MPLIERTDRRTRVQLKVEQAHLPMVYGRLRPRKLNGATAIDVIDGKAIWGSAFAKRISLMPYTDGQMMQFHPAVRNAINNIARLPKLRRFSDKEQWCILLSRTALMIQFEDAESLTKYAPLAEKLFAQAVERLLREPARQAHRNPSGRLF